MRLVMRYANFMATVEQVSGLDRDQAERAVQATLRTLAERISRGEADDIAAFLPAELRSLLTDVPEPAEPFAYDEFIGRVAERAGVDRDAAAEQARAVFTAIGAAVAPGEISDMVAQLPQDFAPLLEAVGGGRRSAVESDGDVVARVALLAGIDADRARRLTEAVLEPLAVRISAGEVEDLEAELPADLRPALERGLHESRSAVSMPVEAFVERVADREGVSVQQAREHVRAVFTALQQVLSNQEFHDMRAQLSDDYSPLVAPAR
jgi:uncharacterized protein (DUF2267 family)